MNLCKTVSRESLNGFRESEINSPGAKSTIQRSRFSLQEIPALLKSLPVINCIAKKLPEIIFVIWVREVIKKKNCDKAVRLTASRGGGTPPPAWPLLFVKILGLFSHWIWFLDTQNRFYSIVKRLKNAFLMYFYCLFNCPKTAKTVVIMECLQEPPKEFSVVKKYFLGKICFRSYIIIN